LGWCRGADEKGSGCQSGREQLLSVKMAKEQFSLNAWH
jgi:hypothetical protein